MPRPGLRTPVGRGGAFDPAHQKLAPFELDSMLSLVWTRTPQGWRIVHEHVSVKVPPPATQ